MSEPVPLSPEEEAFLRAFARASIVVPRSLEADLLREQGMPLVEYFALMHLSEAPDRRLRMSELAGAAALSLSGMSRVIDRLADLGCVQRQRAADDGRGWHAVLTDAGLDRLRTAWPTHLASVRRHVFAHVAPGSLPAVTTALEGIAGSSACPPAPQACEET